MSQRKGSSFENQGVLDNNPTSASDTTSACLHCSGVSQPGCSQACVTHATPASTLQTQMCTNKAAQGHLFAAALSTLVAHMLNSSLWGWPQSNLTTVLQNLEHVCGSEELGWAQEHLWPGHTPVMVQTCPVWPWVSKLIFLSHFLSAFTHIHLPAAQGAWVDQYVIVSLALWAYGKFKAADRRAAPQSNSCHFTESAMS